MKSNRGGPGIARRHDRPIIAGRACKVCTENKHHKCTSIHCECKACKTTREK